MKPDGVSASLYVLEGKVKVIMQFGLEGLSVEKDEQGRMKEDQKQALLKAMEDAISNWDLGLV